MDIVDARWALLRQAAGINSTLSPLAGFRDISQRLRRIVYAFMLHAHVLAIFAKS
jgi:hypothetical protein